MAGRTRFRVQGFDYVAGRLTATMEATARDEGHALHQAEALARRLAGTAALALTTQADGVETCMILGAFGDVPDDFADGLAGG